jgi:GNAT superfamily N-acetyltransferase
VAAGILQCLAGQIDRWDLAVLQAMVMDENSTAARIFLAGGFSILCRLKIMDARVGVEVPEDRSEEIRWLTFDRIPEERFSDLILQTYDASRDCPRLTGLRTGREILAGHRYSGLFAPDAWTILRFRDRDAGVLIMNNTEEDPQQMELVYMGLVPWARGANLGDCLLARAFSLARQKGKKMIRLAVDCENDPAIRLYHRFGFQEISRQIILAVLNESRRHKERNHGR